MRMALVLTWEKASFLISGLIVALKNKVWCFLVSIFLMYFMSSMKPRSSMWSASSSTRVSTLFRRM